MHLLSRFFLGLFSLIHIVMILRRWLVLLALIVHFYLFIYLSIFVYMQKQQSLLLKFEAICEDGRHPSTYEINDGEVNDYTHLGDREEIGFSTHIASCIPYLRKLPFVRRGGDVVKLRERLLAKKFTGDFCWAVCWGVRESMYGRVADIG